mgnify:CR=1 FL=1
MLNLTEAPHSFFGVRLLGFTQIPQIPQDLHAWR